MKKDLICITCPNSCRLSAELFDDGTVSVSGNTCKRGEVFAENELKHPMRSLTTTVRTAFPKMPVLPVRTNGEIPKEMIFPVMRILSVLVVDRMVCCGDVIASDVAGTGCEVIATLDLHL